MTLIINLVSRTSLLKEKQRVLDNDRMIKEENIKLQEEIEKYLGATLIQLILLSGVYNDSSDTSKKEEFFFFK